MTASINLDHTARRLPNPSRWTSDHVAAIALGPSQCAPEIASSDFAPIEPGIGIWDAWPVLDRTGEFFRFDNGSILWMALGAPRFEDPDDRHAHARIHLLLHTKLEWHDLGPALPERFSPGSREWSGSAIVEADRRTLTLYFTAAGSRDETEVTFDQRLFEARATVTGDGCDCRLEQWRDLRESVALDQSHYMSPANAGGTVGTIKAFRDPAYFRDPATGDHYLFFTGSLAQSPSPFNGVIGVASAPKDAPSDWRILPPVISADGLNNELERPHVLFHQGLYYLFWSTQSHVFSPGASTAPTGLYGMVSAQLLSGWKPLNGTGLVIANPPSAPRQAYSWLVLPDLSVTSFVDAWQQQDFVTRPAGFGGSFAPFLRLRLAGSTAKLER